MLIGDNIIRIRKLRKMTRKNLSKDSGVNYHTLENIEMNRATNPKIGNIKKIARCLSVPIDLLVCDDAPEGMTLSLPEKFLKILADPEISQFLSDLSVILRIRGPEKTKSK